MTILAVTTAPNQLITLAKGQVHVGHIVLRHPGAIIDGQGSTLRLDGQFNSAVAADTITAGGPVATATVRNLVVDADEQANCLGLFITAQDGLQRLTLENITARNHVRASVAVVNGAALVASGLTVRGDGAGVQADTGSTLTYLRGITVYGGRAGFVNSAGVVGSMPGIDIDGWTSHLDYWASPSCEAVTPTGFGEVYVDVVSHGGVAARSLVDAIRILTPVATFDTEKTLRSSLVKRWDRIETADRRWTQVLGIGPGNTAQLDDWRAAGSWRVIARPSALATVYRVSLGRLFDHGPTRLLIRDGSGAPSQSNWQGVEGELHVPTAAAGVRVDILRHGLGEGQIRDVDSGAIHVTGSALNPIVRRVSVRGGFADCITLRGVGGIAEDCDAECGQDMTFTATATLGGQILRRCRASRAGVHGFYLGGGTHRLENSVASLNGRHGYGWGVGVDVGAEESYIQVIDDDEPNMLGLVPPHATLVTASFRRANAAVRSSRGGGRGRRR